MKTTFKDSIQYIGIPSLTLSLNDLNRILKDLTELNERGKKLEFEFISKNPTITEKLSDEQIKKELEKAMVTVVNVETEDGNKIVWSNLSQIDENELPHNIKTISIHNKSDAFRNATQRVPMNNFEVLFDFSLKSALDMSLVPTYGTGNESQLTIMAIDDVWGTGVRKKVMDTVKSLKTGRSLIHRKGSYDVFLWLFWVPLLLVNVSKIENNLSSMFSGLSVPFVTVIYICLFIVCLYFFRFLFGYSQWLFPYIELKTVSKKANWGHRVFFGSIAAVFVFPALYDLLKWVWGHFFG